MNKKVATKPEAPRIPAQDLFNRLLKENNLIVGISPGTNVRTVSDGSMIIDAPFVTVRYKDA